MDKLSPYDVLNALIPGTLFAYCVSLTTTLPLLSEQQLVALIVCFGYGLILSRIGSIVIEPAYIKVGFINRPNTYADFVTASSKDGKIDRLVEVRNMYRTICSSIASFLPIYLIFGEDESFTREWYFSLSIIIMLLLLFSLSWRKQEMFIHARVVRANS